MDSYHSGEQAGFRKRFSTIDHLETIKTLTEKTTEYNIPIYLTFIDYSKIFGSIETWAVMVAMDDARID